MPSGLEWIDLTAPMTFQGLPRKTPDPLFLMSLNLVSTESGAAQPVPFSSVNDVASAGASASILVILIGETSVARVCARPLSGSARHPYPSSQPERAAT